MRKPIFADRLPLLRRALSGSCQVYIVIFVLLLFRREGLPFAQAFMWSVQVIPPVLAGVCSLGYARRQSTLPRACRIAWRLMGLGGIAFGVGLIIRLSQQSVRATPPWLSGLVDVGQLAAYLCLLAAALFLFSSARVPRRGRLLIDSALVFSSIAILTWYFLGQRFWYAKLSWPDKMIGSGHAFTDALLLAAAILLVRGAVARRNLHLPWLYLSGSMALLAVADIASMMDRLNGSNGPLGWVAWLWPVGWLLIGYGSHKQWELQQTEAQENTLQDTQEAATPEDTTRWFFSVLAPYLAVAVAFMVVIAHDYSADRAFNNPLFLLGFILILLVIAGEVLNLLETQRWAMQLRSFNASLEQTVARRTAQLGALHLLTKSINNTLQVQQVLAAALSHTHQALQADVVVIWQKSRPTDTSPRFHIYPDGALNTRPEIWKFLSELPLRESVETVVLHSSGTSDNQHNALQHETHYGGYCLRAPLLWQGQSSGVIGVIRWDNTFDNTEVGMLESVGLEVGTALENALRYEAAVEAADRDSVTGLLNHRAIHQCLDSEFERLSGQDRSLSIIMMDLDNFKLFNDVHGHPIGDQVLKQVARVLKSECRNFDIVGRYGGDEFIAILPDTDRETALQVARHLHERTMQQGFLPPEDNRTIPVSLSFGIAAFPLDSTNRHELLTIADANLYAAKQSEERISSTSEAQRTRRELLSSEGSFDILDAMVTAVDNKDRYTRHHSEDVTEYALWLAEELGYSEDTMRVTRVGGLLHDVGKIGVPEDILRKPNRLSQEEFEAMKHHPQLGALIIGGVPGMESVLDAVLYHHERWDGRGYPDGLSGEDIPVLGRILAVADAFSAMTTTRPYRKALTWDAALQEIETNAGSQFDPAMASAFLTAADKHRPTPKTAALSDN
jgi:diguanylate cyclase (GGDEF)-like protein/putative nucleotidyltransferase with HDIG domain